MSTQNVNTYEINAISGVNAIQLPDVMAGVHTKTLRTPLLCRDMNANTTGGHIIATDAIKTNRDIIESNVFIDSSVKPNTYPILSENMTQEMDKPLTTPQSISDITDGTDSNYTAVNAPAVQLMARTFADQPLTSGSTACETENGSNLSSVERTTDLVDNISREYDRRVSEVVKQSYRFSHAGFLQFPSRHLCKHRTSTHPQCPPQSWTDFCKDIRPEFHYMSAAMRRSCGHSVEINCQCLPSPPQQTFSLPVHDITPVSVRVERNRGSDTGQRPRIVRSAFDRGLDYRCSWPGCDRAFQTEWGIRKHYETTHAADRLPVYACHWPGCAFKTNDKHGLVEHIVESHNKIIGAKTRSPEECLLPSDFYGQQLSTPDDIIEPNLVIDFNDSQSNDPSADPLVSDNGAEDDRPSPTITSQDTAPATDPEVYRCLECHKSFLTRRGLEVHNGMRHAIARNGRLKKYRCYRADCRRRVVSLDKLYDHTINDHARTIGANFLDKDFGPNNTANSGRHISHDKIIGKKTRSPEECLSPCDMNGQQLATDHDDDYDCGDTIEPNLVIDLNPTESVKQNTHSIVSADNRIDETQVMAIESTQEIIDILDSDDTEDTSDTMDSQSGVAVHKQTSDNSSHNPLIYSQSRNNMGYTLTSSQNTSPSRWVSSAVHYQLSTGSRAPVGSVPSAAVRVCPIHSCGLCFYNMYQLRAHVNGQHPEAVALLSLLPKRFPCPAVGCGKLFASKQYLNVHIGTAHTGLTVALSKPYSCPVRECRSRGYSSLTSLKQHIKKCHTPSSAVHSMITLKLYAVVVTKPMKQRIIIRDLMNVSLEDNKKLRKEIEIFHELIKFNKMYHTLKVMENVDTININVNSAMSETIVIHDLLDELRELNEILRKKLSFKRQLNEMLENMKQKSLKNYHSLKKTQNSNNKQINTKSGVNAKRFWQLLRHKLPHLMAGVHTKTHRRPLLSPNVNDITTGHTFTAGNHMMATDAIKTTSDIIEPNIVSIDLNPTESVKQNSYPIIIADNGLEVLPPIGDDGTQAADNQFKTKQEIIDILDDSDSEDTAATPVTSTVPTATVHHYASVNQTADICLQTHNGMSYRKPMDQLHASGDQQSTAQMAGHITAGFVKDLTLIPVVHNGSESNDNGTKNRSLMSGINETQVVDNETTQEIIDLLDSDNDCIEDTTDISSTAQPVLSSIVCPVNACGKRYPNQYHFKNHVMAAHPGLNVPLSARVKPYPSPRIDCFKSYQSVQSLQQHIQTYHRLSTAPATTTTTFELATNPRNPPLTITGENTVPATDPEVYQCLECHKSFLTRKGLQTHNGLRHTKSRNDRFN
ncbi:unnamed protein product, partial [Medioppia subpectinata]